MAQHTPTAEIMYRYIRWCNVNIGLRRCSPMQLSSVNRLSRKQRKDYNPLYLHAIADHSIWVDDIDTINTFKIQDVSEMAVNNSKSSKRRPIPRAVRFTVWNTYVGKSQGMGECCCCRAFVSQQDFECGHVLAASKGGSDDVANLRVLCHSCNSSMGSMHMDEFIRLYFPDA